MQITIRNIRISSMFFLIMGAIILQPPVFLWADEVPRIDPSVVKPLAEASRVAAPAVHTRKALSEETVKKAETLKNISQGLSNGVSSDAASVSASGTGRRSSAKEKIWIHPVSGTPRQIRLKAPEAGNVSRRRTRTQHETAARDFLKNYQGLLRIDDPAQEFVAECSLNDEQGFTHIRFSQTWHNIPVWPCEINVHLDGTGNVYMMNGTSVATPRKMITAPAISADRAVELAVAHVKSSADAGTQTPELVIYAPGDRLPRLAWKTGVTVSLSEDRLVVVDAQNGNILTDWDRIPESAATGTGTDLYNEQRSFGLWYEDSRYYMIDTSKTMYNASRSNPPEIAKTYGAIFILDMDHQNPEYFWSQPSQIYTSSPDGGWLSDAVSAARNVSETYDYYQERHSRNSLDGQGGSITAVVRVGDDYENAFWNSETQTIYLGDGQPFARALDVVAHELTHGVVSYTANLIYRSQPGALNEAFADIFGEMTEARTNGSPDWKMGTGLPETIRNMANPGSSGDPAHMNEYYSGTNDYGGVHINATIVTHAFYLLAAGMNGAIGLRDSERIFYQALVHHLVANSQFVDARLACIASAEELFGAGSAQALRTAEAFDAVGISDGEGTSSETSSRPAVSGPDAALFLRYDSSRGGYYLGRRTSNDSSDGTILTQSRVRAARPSVDSTGETAFFVNALNDPCFISTDGSGTEECMGWWDTHSVAMSPDGNLFAFVFLDDNGDPSDSVAVVDLRVEPVADGISIFKLTAPTFDGVSTSTILNADAMSFTADNRYIIYDAHNVLTLNDGTKSGAWSIYAIDLETQQINVVMPPVAGYDIGFPALSRTTDDYLTFDAYNTVSGSSEIYTLNRITGDLKVIANVDGNWGVPSYTGDDSAVVYSKADPDASTGYALWKQALAGDRSTPSGSPSFYLENSDFGTIYRRASETATDDGEGSGGGGGCFIKKFLK